MTICPQKNCVCFPKKQLIKNRISPDSKSFNTSVLYTDSIAILVHTASEPTDARDRCLVSTESVQDETRVL